jgi:hypothetical protein
MEYEALQRYCHLAKELVIKATKREIPDSLLGAAINKADAQEVVASYKLEVKSEDHLQGGGYDLCLSISV